MISKLKIAIILLFIFGAKLNAQVNGIILGNVKDKNTQVLIKGATVFVIGLTTSVETDEEGNFKISVPVGSYSLRAEYINYLSLVKENLNVTSGNALLVNFELEQEVTRLDTLLITYKKGKSAIATDMVTPLSVQQLTSEEIKSNPGGNYDVSKVVQTLPGVGGSSGGAQRNDIIIRGGAPNENVYYLDGIEIPVLNHFQTQGSSGGATGILNVSFIEDLKLSSSAFDARYDNALASTFVIKQKLGNREKLSGNARVSATDVSLTLEGPVNKKTTFLASARRSYLKYLFIAIDLPIRPDYTDFQYKVTHKFNKKTSLIALGLGAYDVFEFATPKKSTPENIYVTRSLPYINQWNYTTGFALKHLISDGFMNFTLSRNMFNNALDKFEDSKQIEANRTFKLRSQEIENKFRWDLNKYVNGWKFSTGVMAQYVKYNTKFFSQVTNPISDSLGNIIIPAIKINFKSAIEFFKYGAFANVAKNILNDKLLVSFGLRTDLNSFLQNGNNPLTTLSPRLSLSYQLSKKFDLTGSVGVYNKIPTYTTMGFRDQNGVLSNKNMKYIQSTHYVLGTQFLPSEALRFTLEGFYKTYKNYAVSAKSGISLANQGGDFGSIGSEKINSNGLGECYGFEFFVQQKLIKNIFYVLSYTYVRSTFTGTNGRYIASSWDNQHLISGTLGYKFKKNWQLGLKYRLAGGSPYTPFDNVASQQNYLLLGTGTLDFNNLNSNRLNTFNQLDVRLDKKVNFKKVSFEFFIDVTNILAFVQQSPPNYTFKRNATNTNFETTDGNALKQDGSNAIPVILPNNSGRPTPSIGVIFEF